jgi:hypothetical protein
MEEAHADLASFFQSILDKAAQNITFAKLLILLHLDPNDVTVGATLHQISDIALNSITIPNFCALLGASFYAATFLMPRMIPLRVFGILSALFFMTYGLLATAVGTFLMYLLLLPINSARLYQIMKLVRKARTATAGDMSIDWIKSYMDTRRYKKGEIVFRKGQIATEMLLVAEGKFLIPEIGIEVLPGRIIGELGFVTPTNKRTQSVECIEDGAVMTITYDRLLQIYFEQPDFGYFMLRLATSRLIENNARLEAELAGYKQKARMANSSDVLVRD